MTHISSKRRKYQGAIEFLGERKTTEEVFHLVAESSHAETEDDVSVFVPLERRTFTVHHTRRSEVLARQTPEADENEESEEQEETRHLTAATCCESLKRKQMSRKAVTNLSILSINNQYDSYVNFQQPCISKLT